MTSPAHPSILGSWLLSAASIVLTTTIAITADVSRPPGGREDQPQTQVRQAVSRDRDDADLVRVGKELVKNSCDGAFHDLENIYTKRRTQREWSDTVTDMISRGAVGTEEQFATIKQYLTRTFGIVAINTAAAAEISAVLGLSPKDAAAIVDYRKAHGNFADLAALAKVESIDKAKIDAQPEAVIFK